MNEDMQDDFAEVLYCGENGEYMVQRKSEGISIFGAVKLMLKYRFTDHPHDIGFRNTG
jgi:hypothetical protein